MVRRGGLGKGAGVSETVASLLADVRERFVTYARGGRNNPSLVLADEAGANARELWRAVQSASPDGCMSFDVVNMIAWLHWSRYYALPVGQDRNDLQVAAVLFAHLYQVDPELVPDELLQMRVSENNDDLVIPGNEGDVEDNMEMPAWYPSSYSSSSYPSSHDPEVSDGPDWWTRQAAVILRRKQTIDDPDALDRAIDLLRSALGATPAGDPGRVVPLLNLCSGLERRYERSTDPADLEEAITAGRAAVEASSADHPKRATMLSNLGAVLRLRFERVGDLVDLEEAVRVGHAAVESTPADHPSRAGYLSNLQRAMRLWPEQVGNGADPVER
jgi:hypothetical protein